MTTAPENAGRKQAGRFKPGKSGNPAGKPPGTRNKATRAMEKLLDDEAEDITRKAIEMAKAGDGPALRLCMDRLLPPRRDRHVAFTLPTIETAADAATAAGALLAAVSAGDITPAEATELGRLLESYVKRWRRPNSRIVSPAWSRGHSNEPEAAATPPEVGTERTAPSRARGGDQGPRGDGDEDAVTLYAEMAAAGHPVLPQDMVVQSRVLNWPKDGAPLPESCRGIISWGNGWGKAA